LHILLIYHSMHVSLAKCIDPYMCDLAQLGGHISRNRLFSLFKCHLNTPPMRDTTKSLNTTIA